MASTGGDTIEQALGGQEMTTTYLIALSNGLAERQPTNETERLEIARIKRVKAEELANALKPKCKHCSNSVYKDGEYCFPHLLGEERANE